MSRVSGQNLSTAPPTPITPAHTLAPNDIISARRQRPDLGYFGLIFAKWEEMEMCRPSLYTVYGMHQYDPSV